MRIAYATKYVAIILNLYINHLHVRYYKEILMNL